IGAWLNLGLVIWFAARRGHLGSDPPLRGATAGLTAGGVALAAVLWLAPGPVARLVASWTSWRGESTLAELAPLGAARYSVLPRFGTQGLAALRTRKRPHRRAPPSPD